MAVVFCASLSRFATVSRIRFILTRCSERVPAISFVGSSGGILTMGAGPEAADAASGAGRMADTGVSERGAVGMGGAGGGAVGTGPADDAAGGGGGGGGAAATSSCNNGGQ